MEQLKDFLKLFYIPSFNFGDFVEITIIIIVIYKLITSIKNTRAWIIFKGMLILVGFYLISYICSFEIIKILFQGAISLFSIVLVVVFQQDIRKILEQIGNKSFKQYYLDWKNKKYKTEIPKRMSDKTIDELVKGVFELGKAKTGSLIVIEKDIPLNDIISTGIDIDSEISSALLINIFEKNTPLHDGAVVVKNNRIASATCYLPLSNNTEISKSLGTRHRAGIGVTEAVDCFVIISSEETGAISYVENGKITRNITPEKLTKALRRIQNYPAPEILIKPKFDLFSSNTATKFLSIFLGIFLWIFMMSAIDPVTTTVIKDVPIQIKNEKAITTLGKTYDLNDIETVDVKIEDKSSIIKELQQDDITAFIDLSKLSYVNTVDVEVSVNNSTTEIKHISDTVLKVRLEDVSYGEFPIEVKTKGKPSAGYSISEISLSNSSVGITGSKSLIRKIDKVVAVLDVNNITDGQKLNFTPTVYDKNGDIINNEKLSFNISDFHAYITLAETKEISLNIRVENQTDSAGIIKDITYNPSKIKISGEESELKQLNGLNITVPLKIELNNITDKELTKVINLSDYLPEGVSIASDKQKVTITISYEPYPSKTISIPTSEIVIKNQNPEYDYFLSGDSLSLIIASQNESLTDVNLSDFTFAVDVENSITSGDFVVSIQTDKNVMIGNLKVPIEITKK